MLSWFRLICRQWWGQSRDATTSFFWTKVKGEVGRRRKWCNRFPAGSSLYFPLWNSGESRIRNSAFIHFIPAKHTTVIQSKARNIPGRLSARARSIISIHGTAADANLVFREIAPRSRTRCQFFQCGQPSQNSHRCVFYQTLSEKLKRWMRIWEIRTFLEILLTDGRRRSWWKKLVKWLSWHEGTLSKSRIA